MRITKATVVATGALAAFAVTSAAPAFAAAADTNSSDTNATVMTPVYEGQHQAAAQRRGEDRAVVMLLQELDQLDHADHAEDQHDPQAGRADAARDELTVDQQAQDHDAQGEFCYHLYSMWLVRAAALGRAGGLAGGTNSRYGHPPRELCAGCRNLTVTSVMEGPIGPRCVSRPGRCPVNLEVGGMTSWGQIGGLDGPARTSAQTT